MVASAKVAAAGCLGRRRRGRRLGEGDWRFFGGPFQRHSTIGSPAVRHPLAFPSSPRVVGGSSRSSTPSPRCALRATS